MVELKQRAVNAINKIAEKEYWGRMVIVGSFSDGGGGGARGDYDFGAYFPTGRSAGSKARYLNFDESTGTVAVEPSKDAKQGEGNPALIYYNAVQLLDNGAIVLSNGMQTDLIVETYEMLKKHGKDVDPLTLLREAFKRPKVINNFYEKSDGTKVRKRIDITAHEPDKPNFTPRVSAVLGLEKAAMCIAFSPDGLFPNLTERHYFEIPLIGGSANCLPTYTGTNVREDEILPHYEGIPFSLQMGKDIGAFAESLDNSLGPKEGKDCIAWDEDFRVGVVVIARNRFDHSLEVRVINHHEPAPDDLKQEILGGDKFSF
jgi:hypothetical protein